MTKKDLFIEFAQPNVSRKKHWNSRIKRRKQIK